MIIDWIAAVGNNLKTSLTGELISREITSLFDEFFWREYYLLVKH